MKIQSRWSNPEACSGEMKGHWSLLEAIFSQREYDAENTNEKWVYKGQLTPIVPSYLG